jgi:hypothetical protein
MYDLQLEDVTINAVSRIDTEMARCVPFMAERVGTWMRSLSGSEQPAKYFLHPWAFPMLLLPWLVEGTCRADPNLSFQSDLAYSTVNGYYYIRLIDNAMDGDTTVDLKLLPALNFFHTQFQAVYHSYFPAGHPFWDDFTGIWFQSGESAMRDASLSDIGEAQFKQVAAQKVCAVKIPIAAVCYHNEQQAMTEPWFQLADLLGCWHQMMNDLFDWYKDMQCETRTYFLSEAGRRKAQNESIAAWVIREGFAWGCNTLDAWMVELKEMAQNLQSPDLLTYLKEREALFLDRKAQVIAGFQNMARLLAALE